MIEVFMERKENKIVQIKDPGTIPELTQIYFYLTQGCNLACRHCWLAPGFDPNGDKFPFLSVELFETAIREARPLGLSSVKLTGGEPLLHPKIFTLLEIVRRENLALSIETNGLLCSREIAAEISKSPIRRVSVSIDGADAKTHEWIRGVPGSFEKAKEAVRNLAACGTRPQVIMTLMHRNASQMEDVVRLAEMLGASSVKFNIMQPTARGEELSKRGESLSIAEQIRLKDKLENKIAPNARLKLYFDIPIAFRSLRSILKDDPMGICHIQNILGVLATGHYALCGIGVNVPDLVFGKVGEDRLNKLWQENIILNELREGLPNRLRGICSRCLVRDLCLGSCIAENYYSSGNIWAPNPFCEQAENAGLFPESRILLPQEGGGSRIPPLSGRG
jgi:SynChlorMet cassette radical SAM/SPASM protein ScmF